jgi:hypothetical protein
MRRRTKLLSSGGALWLFAAAVCLRAHGQAVGMHQEPSDPDLDPFRMQELLEVPVPSVRAALAQNPSISDDLVRTLARDPYDAVARAAQAAWKRRYPSGGEPLGPTTGAGKKSALPDFGELRDLVDSSQPVRAALAWRRLDVATRMSLLGVCHYSKSTDKLDPLLDFIVMAEPPGGPLASSMASQIISEDPGLLAEMGKRGLMEGLPAFALYSAGIEARRTGFIRSLAESGRSLDDRGADGATPLMVAARTGDMEMILLLLELGARADAVDSNSLTAADHARLSLKVDAAEFLSLTPASRDQAHQLGRGFGRAPANSFWVGRWIAVGSSPGHQEFPCVEFDQDGSFDMSHGPAGRWNEVDPTHLAATPMLKDDRSTGATRTFSGDLAFERLVTIPAQIRVTYRDIVLQFYATSYDRSPAGSYRGGVRTIPAAAKTNPLAAPTGIRAVASLDKASLSWDAPAGATGYFIYRDGSLITTTPVSGPPFIDDMAPAAASATYEVRAVDASLHASARSADVTLATLLKDTDGKGLPDRWQMRYFGHLGVDPNADPDGDGLTNIEEFKKGTDPNDFFNGVDPVVETPYGNKPGPEDQLAMVFRHPDGTPWANAPAPFAVTSGRRMFSAARNQPPFVRSLVVHTDSNGLAQVFLQPLSQP